jgi:hypothetical protein
LLLGLLESIPAIVDDLRRSGERRHAIPVTAAIFIRADIYGHLLATALEPDKLPVRRIMWDEPGRLIDVVNERYAASVEREVAGDEIWSQFFCREIEGSDVRDYIVSRILPRPRDMFVYVRAATEAAILRRSPIVETQDIRSADEAYSQFAFDAIKIEDPTLGEHLESAVIEFAGGSATYDEGQLEDVLASAHVPGEQRAAVVRQLREISFLGLEIEDER